MKLQSALEAIGLSKIEGDVYLSLLKSPGPQPASILANRMGLNRTTAYKALVSLAKLGLATKTVKHGIICFFAENPEDTLKHLIREREETLNNVNNAIIQALPSLIRGDNENVNLPKIRYYEGVEGIKMIYELVLKEGVDYYRYGDIVTIREILGEYFDSYVKRRKKMGIIAHTIMPFHKDSEATNKKNDEFQKVIYLPSELFSIEGEVKIFGNKVAILSLQKDSPIGVVIESDVVARMFRSIFRLTWHNYSKEAFKL